jgi:hypothetical protein
LCVLSYRPTEAPYESARADPSRVPISSLAVATMSAAGTACAGVATAVADENAIVRASSSRDALGDLNMTAGPLR